MTRDQLAELVLTDIDFRVVDFQVSEFLVDKGWLVAVLHAEGPATVQVQSFDGVAALVSAR